MEVKKTDKIQRYIDQSMHYLENTVHSIEIGEIEKASEFLWGSFSQALKALAASRNIVLKSHDEIKKYAMDVSKELKDEGIWYAFIEAQSLHSNFYETGLQMEDVKFGFENIRRAIKRLLSLIPDKRKNKEEV